jgi:nucleoside-diphosphate-sugar epimerase
MKIDKVLITGISGFVGKNLKNIIKSKDYQYITPSRKILNLNNYKSVETYLNKHKPKFIINLVSRTIPKMHSISESKKQKKNTIEPLTNICLASPASVKLIIGVGTIEEYGIQSAPFIETMKPKPISSYAKAKYTSFLNLKKICSKKKINYVWLRPSLMFGNDMNDSRLMKLIINSYKKKKKLNIKNPNSVRDYLYVEDFCKILILLINNYKQFKDQVINITNENWLSNKELVDKFNIIVGKNSEIVFSEEKKIEKMKKLYNSGKKFKKFFTKFIFTSLNEAISRTSKNYKILK